MKQFFLDRGSELSLFEGWLSEEKATQLETTLNVLAWQQREIWLWGKAVMEPRETLWLGDKPYRYSGRTNYPDPWPEALQEVRERLLEFGVFNSCLLNRYRDGKDSISPHSDNEPELGHIPTIASLSLGSTRTFRVISKDRTKNQKFDLELQHGSLVIMGGTMQQHYLHCVPKQPKVTQPRINLTFRFIT